jgi:hypothetical protein
MLLSSNGGPPGAVLFSGTSSLTSTSLGTNNGYSLYRENFTIPLDTLGAGTYFLAIQAVSSNFGTYLMYGVATGGIAFTSDGGATWSYNPNSGESIAVSLDAVATPLPAALPLFATGLAGLGLLGWRRKRKAQASRRLFSI